MLIILLKFTAPASKKRKVDDISPSDSEIQKQEESRVLNDGASPTSSSASTISCPSTSRSGPELIAQRTYVIHDLIHLLMGTIDSLDRSIAPVSTEEEPEVAEGESSEAEKSSTSSSATANISSSSPNEDGRSDSTENSTPTVDQP